MSEVRGVTSDGREFSLPLSDELKAMQDKINETLANLAGVTGYMVRTAGEQSPEVFSVRFESDSERVRREARARLNGKRRVRAALTRYAQLVETTSGPLRAVVDLHQPRIYGGRLECDGCDPGEYAESSPGWPCTTWETIELGSPP